MNTPSKRPPIANATTGSNAAATAASFAAQAATSAASTAAKAFSDTSEGFFQAMMSGFDTSRKASQQGYEQMTATMQEQMDRMNKMISDAYTEFSNLAKDNADAYTQASNKMAKAVEDVGKAIINLMQQSVESNVSAAKAMVSTKNAREAFDVQADWAKNSLDSFMSESTRISEMSVKLANQAIEPIQDRANQTVERLMKVAK